MLRFHTQTAGSTLTAQQPLNNVVRVTLQALAAVLGGTQSLHTNSFDEALSLPTEEAVRVALRTQQIIAHESGVVQTVDPLGGSYYLEHLTGEVERRAREYLERIESMGGVIKAIEKGFIKQEIEKSAYAYQKEVESGKRAVVGVNRFTGEERKMPILRIDPAIEEDQKDRLTALRKNRSWAPAERSLELLEKAARAGENLLPPMIEAARNKVTIGEMCNVLRKVYGTFEEAGGT
jgi:methylmalonyl-CoA mutase N-terminal domain/subunit